MDDLRDYEPTSMDQSVNPYLDLTNAKLNNMSLSGDSGSTQKKSKRAKAAKKSHSKTKEDK